MTIIFGCWLPWFSYCLVLNGHDGYCLGTNCDCSGSNVINCHDKGLTLIPSFHATHTHSHSSISTLDFSSNNISIVPALAFHFLFRQHGGHFRINLSNNRIWSVNAHAFNGIDDKIVEVNLENNLLQNIPFSVTQLPHLRHLYVASNPILAFDSGVVQHLSSLNELSFGHANLTRWPTELFHLSHLSLLRVSGGKISDIPSNAFVHSSITDLTLKETDLYDFPIALCSLRRLHRLEFSSNVNHASEVGFFKPCQHALSNMIELILDNDDFYRVPTDIFGTFPNLQILRIRGSSLLSTLDDLVVPLNCRLKTLDLSGNSFATIPDVISRMPSLIEVDVSNNPMICSCFMNWMKTWPRRDDVNIIGDCQGGEQIRHYMNNSLQNFC